MADDARKYDRIRCLDGVRGVAILMVVFYHSTPFEPDNSFIEACFYGFRSILWIGVDLFFVLSGFLITGILVRTRDHPHYFRNFYARRSLRIFPLYYGVLTVVLIVLPICLSLAGKTFPPELLVLQERQFWLWTYTQNFVQAQGQHQLPGFGPFWSLAIEEQFYLAWPLILYFTAPQRHLAMCGVLCVIVALVRIALFELGILDGWAIYHLTPTRMDGLLFGAMAGLIWTHHSTKQIRKSHLLFIVIVAASVLCVQLFRTGKATLHQPEIVYLGYTMVSMAFAAMILLLITQPSRSFLRRAFESRWLGVFGKYSYGLYVFHWPVARGLRLAAERFRMFPDDITGGDVLEGCFRFAFVTVISLSLAVASWHLWELKWLKFKRRFDYE